MYVLMLTVICITLILISILISNGLIAYSYQYGNKTDTNSVPHYLFGNNVIEVDISRSTCAADTKSEFFQSENIGLYNLSVLKYSNGYNGIIRGSTWNGCCINNIYPTFSYPYIIKLDNHGAITDLRLIELDYNNFNNCREHFRGIHANGIEDPKLFMFQGEEWAIANCLGHNDQPHPCVNAICIFKLSNPNNTLRVLSPPLGIDILQRQKNWSPFEWNGKLLCEYSINPHIILEIDVDKGTTSELYNTIYMKDSSCADITTETSLRGGASPILLKYKGNIFYFGVGHVRSKETSDYLHFFYIFEAQPPFSLLKISKYFKFDGLEKIQFVAGVSYYDDHIYISYGVDDCYNRISNHELDKIMSLLF